MLLRALVYRYGCGAPVSGLEHALAEQERSSDLWDQLVKLDRTIEGQILQAAGLDDPAIMRAGEGIADLTGRLAEDPDDKLAREERRKLYAERRALLKVWNKAHKEVLREYEVRRQAGTKILRQQSEAWWPNQNRVLQAYEAARQLCRKTGRRLRLYDIDRDDGVLAYQIQRSPSTQVQRVPDPEGPKGFRIVSSDLGCSPEELQDGTVRAIQIGRVDPRAYDPATCRGERDRLHRTTVEMRVDAQGHTVRLPVWMHRPLPPGSRVKAAQITWYRRAARLHWQLCLTLNVPAIPLRVASATAPADVEFLWAREGGLNVLSVTPPEGAAPSIWALPPRWLGRADLIARRSSESEAQLRALREAVSGDVDLEDICATNSVPQIMDLLQLRWTRLRPAVRDAYQVLRREWKAHEGLRGKVIRDRRDYYRRIAREIVSRWDVIALRELDLSALATANRGDPLNADRHLAAPHTLRAEIIHQAAKAGCHVIASGPGITPREKRESTRWARLQSLAKQVSQRRAQSPDHAGV